MNLLIEITLIFTILQSALVSIAAFLFMLKERKIKTGLVLISIFFLIVTVRTGSFYINNYYSDVNWGTEVNYLLRVFTFIAPAIFYLFILELSGKLLTSFKRYKIVLHFIPGIIFLTAVLLFFYGGFKGSASIQWILSAPVRGVAEISLILIYGVLSLKLLYKSSHKINFSKELKYSVWLFVLTGLFSIPGLLQISLGPLLISDFNLYVLVHSLKAVFIFSLTIAVIMNVIERKYKVGLKKTYVRSGLKHHEALKLKNELQVLIADENWYRNQDLDLGMLADELNVLRTEISQVISEYMQSRFNDLVNNCRYEHSVKLLSDPAFSDKNISEIAYESGFNSLSTFNRVFKENSGKTPSEFRKYCSSNRMRRQN